jgi:predicted dehydrogenase
MSDQIRIALIGTGQIGTRHLQKYAEIPDAQVVAICDLREGHARSLADQFDVADVYADYREMLARDDIDAVDVCLHNRLHRPVTIDVLEAGKHCYCEKPMSWTYADARAMYDAAQRTGHKLHIQLGTIYQNEARAAKRIIDEGHLGRIYFAKTIHYRRRGRPYVDGYGTPAFVNTATSGGGAMLDMAVYHISLILYLLGNPAPESVSGATYQMLENMYADRRQESGYNVEELGMAYIRLAGGISLMMEEAWAIQSDNPGNDQIMGSRGGLRVDPLTFFTTLADLEMDGTFDVKQALWRWEQHDPLQVCYSESQRHWVAALQGRVPLIDTAGIALNTALITEGVYLSSLRGREVTCAEIEDAEPGLGREQA